MKCCLFGFIIALLGGVAIATEEAETTLVKTGVAAPPFSAMTTDQAEFSTEKLKGKVILVNFFATWCGPCLQELPHLESKVWAKFKDQGLAVVAVGREHSVDELAKFKAEKKLTFPVAADPKREAYGKYATMYIPRNFVIGGDGKIVFQSVGFVPAEFDQMIKVIESELAKTR
jgi:peroxiredoxin